jgi:hypothetical protein
MPVAEGLRLAADEKRPVSEDVSGADLHFDEDE